MNMTDIVMFSGGSASYCAAKRVPGATLLFADTGMEDEDLYRFLDDAELRLNNKIVRISHGLTPWELFHQRGMIGNTRAALCSRILKRELLDKWIADNAESPTVHFGFDASEARRLEVVRTAKPYRCEAPLMWNPILMFKQQQFDILAADDIKLPRLYRMGFMHNNCGGFCIKAGQAHFARLLHKMPERYAFHEEQEQQFRHETGKDVAILRDRVGGSTKPLTLKDFREGIQSGGLFDRDDEGGCNCLAPADIGEPVAEPEAIRHGQTRVDP